MEPLIIFGGTVFWVIFVIFVIAMITSIEYDSGLGASIITAAMVVGLIWGAEINIFAWIWTNLFLAFTYFVGYFIAGAIWGTTKWWFYCHKLLDVVKDIKVEFLNKFNITDNVIPDNKRDDFEAKVLSDVSKYHDRYFPPRALDHKSDWLMWATWWPFSFFWTMLNQPIKNMWLFIYSHIGGLMQKISDSVFKGI